MSKDFLVINYGSGTGVSWFFLIACIIVVASWALMYRNKKR